MQNKRHSYSAEPKITELMALYEITTALSQARRPETALKKILTILSEKLEMKRGTITLLKENGEILIEVAHGLSASEKRRGKYQLGEGITGKVIAAGRMAVVPSIDSEPLFMDRTRSRRHLDKKSIAFICVPIKIENTVIGALSIDRQGETSESFDDDVRVLSIVASLISQSLKKIRQIEREKEQLLADNKRLQKQLEARFRPDNLIGNSQAMQAVYQQIHTVAQTGATVLIDGESGTGKELVASAIHYSSPRAQKPFVKVNCAALPETLFESELFGYERGAFSGALSAKPGRFELAEGGTIFLDEIAELSLAVQAKLLRVLQEKEIERLGGTATLKVDVRVIAATNQDLLKATEEKTFRDDLYYRLSVFPIHLPSLRERKSDITLLTDYFLELSAQEHKKDIVRICTPAIDMLMSYHWPGNVRELQNVIERAVLLADERVIHGYHLPPTLQTAGMTHTERTGCLEDMVANFEREIITEALHKNGGNISAVARLLKTTHRVISYKLKKLAINL